MTTKEKQAAAEQALKLVAETRKAIANAEAVEKLDKELDLLIPKLIDETDPEDNAAVRKLGDANTQKLLIPARRERATENLRAAADKLETAMEQALYAVKDAIAEDKAAHLEKITALLAPYCKGFKKEEIEGIAIRTGVLFYIENQLNELPSVRDGHERGLDYAASMMARAEAAAALVTHFIKDGETFTKNYGK